MQQVGVYRPSNDISKGTAFQFKFGYKKDEKTPVMFIEATRQTKPKPPAGSTSSPFDWGKEHKIAIMLNVHEVSQLNALISRIAPFQNAKFIHQTDVGMKNLTVTPPTTEAAKKYGNWGFSLQSRPTEGDEKRVNCFVDSGELYQIKLLGDIIIDYYLRMRHENQSTQIKT